MLWPRNGSKRYENDDVIRMSNVRRPRACDVAWSETSSRNVVARESLCSAYSPTVLVDTTVHGLVVLSRDNVDGSAPAPSVRQNVCNSPKDV